MEKLDQNIKIVRVFNEDQLIQLEETSRRFQKSDMNPIARNTPWTELAQSMIPDKDGLWAHPIYLYQGRYLSALGVSEITKAAHDFLKEEKKTKPIDILSISAGVDGSSILLLALIRNYDEKNKVVFRHFRSYLKEESLLEEARKIKDSHLVVPKDAILSYSKEEEERHKEERKRQEELLADESIPFLNRIDHYVPKELPKLKRGSNLIYDMKTKDRQRQLNTSYENFTHVFNLAMEYVTNNERSSYFRVLSGEDPMEPFQQDLEEYIKRTFIDTGVFPLVDLESLKEKLNTALFRYYIIQDLIDDPLVSDIKIVDPYNIRCRIKGKAYLSNISFIDDSDYIRFYEGLGTLNNVDIYKEGTVFTSLLDENYRLRFSITPPHISSTGYPAIHIRKLPNKKKMSEQLIKEKMMTEKIRDFLLDCGSLARGVVFSGPPGSGKTTLLNWFLEEAYPISDEILVIQESDELFAEQRKGVIVQHIVNDWRHKRSVSLEDLGRLALVEGVNVFVIGEAKGGEITSAITLANSGCKTAITIHSQSSFDTIDKMADLAMRGNQNISYEHAKKSLLAFDTIVYLEDYKVKEITRLKGYDEEEKKMLYQPLYALDKESCIED